MVPEFAHDNMEGPAVAEGASVIVTLVVVEKMAHPPEAIMV